MTAATLQRTASNPAVLNATRDQLITENLHLVNAIAQHMKRSMSVHVELDDLVHAGMMGLFDAATKFTADKEVSFASYAKHRIRGSILDSLRQIDFASRDLRKRIKQVGSTTRELAAKLHREPTEEEVAKEMGLDSRQWQNLMVDYRNLGVASQTRVERDDQRTPEVPCAPTEVPDQVFARREMRRRLGSVLQGLPVRYQQVVTMYYEGEMTMKEIGETLGVNESRVSQIHKSALLKMQVVLASNGVSSSAAFVN
jgi:RNA polymerase sigma factor FliA